MNYPGMIMLFGTRNIIFDAVSLGERAFNIDISKSYIQLANTCKFTELYRTLHYNINYLWKASIDSDVTEELHRLAYGHDDIIEVVNGEYRLPLRHLINYRGGSLIRLFRLELSFTEPRLISKYLVLKKTDEPVYEFTHIGLSMSTMNEIPVKNLQQFIEIHTTKGDPTWVLFKLKEDSPSTHIYNGPPVNGRPQQYADNQLTHNTSSLSEYLGGDSNINTSWYIIEVTRKPVSIFVSECYVSRWFNPCSIIILCEKAFFCEK